jgi:hypothetical protein
MVSHISHLAGAQVLLLLCVEEQGLRSLSVSQS